eukprot:15366821-Ditylum_brightwellii.AAC.1
MEDTRCSYTSCLEVEFELMQKSNDGLREKSMPCILFAEQLLFLMPNQITELEAPVKQVRVIQHPGQ